MAGDRGKWHPSREATGDAPLISCLCPGGGQGCDLRRSGPHASAHRGWSQACDLRQTAKQAPKPTGTEATQAAPRHRMCTSMECEVICNHPVSIPPTKQQCISRRSATLAAAPRPQRRQLHPPSLQVLELASRSPPPSPSCCQPRPPLQSTMAAVLTLRSALP